MTRPDPDEREEEPVLHKQAVGRAVAEVVKQGLRTDRLTCGADHCVQLLARCPEDIMLCLLAKPSATQDADHTIMHVLLRAYCRDNEIDLLNVEDGQTKLKELLQSCQGPPAVMATKPAKDDSADLEQAVGLDAGRLKHPTEVPSVRQEDGEVTNSPLHEAIGGHLTSRKGYILRLPRDEMSFGVAVTGARGAPNSLQGSTVEPVAEHDLIDSPLDTCYSDQSPGKSQKDVGKLVSSVGHVGYGCVMVKYPKHGKSQEDELVAEYVHQELRKYVEPWVALPDLHHVTSVQAEDNVEVVSVTLPDLHHVTSVQAEDNVEQQQQPPKPTPTTNEEGRAAKLLQQPHRYEVTTPSPPDIGQWTMVKLKKRKAKGK